MLYFPKQQPTADKGQEYIETVRRVDIEIYYPGVDKEKS